MANEDLEQRIVRYVGGADYRPMKPRDIARRLGIAKDEAVEVKRAIKRLVRRGQLAFGSNHLVRSSDGGRGAGNRVVGVFHRTQKGFGFVRPQSPVPRKPAGPRAAAEEVQDIYIPAKKARDASTGDVVVVQVDKRQRGEPRLRGEIVEILERQTQQFVGTYLERDGAAYVQIDGKLFAEPVYVGDPGAKGARPDDKVVLEMLRFPSPLRPGEGVISEVLGPRGKPGVDTLSILREFNLPEEFPADVLREARAEAERFDEDDRGGRLDLTGETIITIDPVDARDFDDAISLVRLDNGDWRLGVHIADVSHFVRPRTALDREAYQRATSVYLPDRVLPMLPEVISNGLASLQPGKVRFAKTAFLGFTADGARSAAEFHSSAIRSAKRLTYEEVDAYLADPQHARRKLGGAVCDLLDRMHSLAMTLRSRRMKHGALELIMPEVKVELDDSGRVTGARVVENTVSHQMIEEFMLAANEAVAEFLAEKELHFLRRIHAAPSPRKLQALTDFIRELGLKVESLESRFEVQNLLQQVSDRPERHAVHFAVLRSMMRAVYGPEEEGHFALASHCYCHFTSPIRRYPDLTVHRMLNALLTGHRPRNDFDEMVVVGQHCSQREQRAEEAERDLTKLKLLAYLSTRIGEEMDALVTGVESFGLFVQGVALPAEGLLHADALADDYYDFDRAGHCLVGRRSGQTYRLGDLLRVAVARVDLERRELDFRLVERRKGKPRPEKPQRAKGRAGKEPIEKPQHEKSPHEKPRQGKERHAQPPHGKPERRAKRRGRRER